jgi:hypothetical protein
MEIVKRLEIRMDHHFDHDLNPREMRAPSIMLEFTQDDINVMTSLVNFAVEQKVEVHRFIRVPSYDHAIYDQISTEELDDEDCLPYRLQFSRIEIDPDGNMHIVLGDDKQDHFYLSSSTFTINHLL